MEEVKQSAEFNRKNVLSVSFAHLMHDIYGAFLAPILPLLINKLGLNYFGAGVLSFSQRFPSLFNPFIGMFIDRLEIRYFVIFTPALTAICMSLIGLAPHFIFAVVLMLSMGVSSAFFHVPAPVMVKTFSGKLTGRGMSYYMVGGELARTLGPIAIIGAVSLWELEGMYRLMPFGIAASIFLWMRFKDVEIQRKSAKENRGEGFKKTFNKHLNFFLLIAGIVLSRAFMKTAIIYFLPTYLDVRGESLWFGGMSLSVFEIAGVAGTFLAGNLSDRLGKMNTLLTVTLITPFTMLLFIYTEGFWILPVLVIMGFFILASGPVLLALVMDQATEHQSFTNSIFMTINFISASATSLIIGKMGDWIGLIETYKVSAFIALTAIPFVIALYRRRKMLK
jgi:FSR family fosmidomycin resistance protein-like MFS transporter